MIGIRFLVQASVRQPARFVLHVSIDNQNERSDRMNGLGPRSDGAEVPELGETLPDRFARIAQLHGSQTALASDNWRPTYVELAADSDLGAQALAALGGEAGDRVAILMRHDVYQVAAL